MPRREACWQRTLARGHKQGFDFPMGFNSYSLCWRSMMGWQPLYSRLQCTTAQPATMELLGCTLQ